MALTRIGPNQSVNLTSNVTGTLPVGNGGIGIASGTTDQFLKFTGTTTLASAADNAGSWVKISTVTCSSTATVEFENLSSDYQMYVIVGSEIRPATTNTDLDINFGTDGSTYAANKTTSFWYTYNNEGDSDTGNSTSGSQSVGGESGDAAIMQSVSNHGNYGKAGTLMLYMSGLGQGGNYASFDAHSCYWQDNNYVAAARVGGMVQAAADCIRFKFSSGNIAAGKFTLFGISQ